MTNPISEYKEAQLRFEGRTDCSSSDSSDHYLDNIIQQLCTKENVDIEPNATLFYQLLIRADYILLKTENMEPFCRKLCNKFFTFDILDDIIKNFKSLEQLPHIKKCFIRELYKILSLTATVENDNLILSFSNSNSFYVHLYTINSITLLPSAYKVLMTNEEFNICCLNFLLHLYEIKNLKLSGCNLNGRNIEALFCGLKLEYLNLSECGTCVNKIIQHNISGILDNLKELDISYNPLMNRTLRSISRVPLKYLNIAHCIKNSGRFINSIWFAEKFASLLNIEGEEAKGNIDLLWEGEVLKGTIEILNVCGNDLSKTNLHLILQTQLTELDITSSLQGNSVDLSDLVIPKTLKTLKACMNRFFLEDLKVLSKSCLKKLEISYFERNNHDYSNLIDSPLRETLQELFILILKANDGLVSFLSSFNLKCLRCAGMNSDTDNGQIILGYISNPKLNRDCLESLEIGSPNLRFSDNYQFFKEFRKLKNLKELSLSSDSFQGEEISSFLRCEYLHASVESLKLCDSYMIKDEDLSEIVKFKKIVKLSFSFTNNISYDNLKNVVELNTLKELNVCATVRGILNYNFARLFCLAPVKMLRICHGGDITAEAYNFIMNSDNFINSKPKPKNLLSIRCVFTINMAKLLRKIDWEDIIFIQCNWQENSTDIFLENENLTYSCNSFSTYTNINRHWKQDCFQKILLSKLRTGDSGSNENLLGIKAISISKVLFSLSLGKIQHEEDIKQLHELLKSNLSVVNGYGLHPRAIKFALGCLGDVEFSELMTS